MSPSPRVTVTTALPTVRGFVNDLARFSNEAGTLSQAQNLKGNLEVLQNLCQESGLEVDVAITSKSGEELNDRLRSEVERNSEGGGNGSVALLSREITDLNKAFPVKIRIWDAKEPPVYRSGTPRPPILIIAADGDEEPDASTRSAMLRASSDRPVVMFACRPAASWKTNFATEVQAAAWYMEIMDIDTLSATSIRKRWSASPWSGCTELLMAHSLANALDSQANVFGMALEGELRGLKAKRALAQQKATKFQQRPGTSSATEMMSDIRSRLQRHFNEFLQGANVRMQTFVAPQNGPIAQGLEEWLAGLSDLERATTSTSTIISLPPKAEEEVLRILHDQLFRYCTSDMIATKDFFGIVHRELDQLMSEVNVPAISWQFRVLDDQKALRILEGQIIFQRHYKGELPKKGFFEYFMSARRYLTVLFMIMSAIGFSRWRSNPEFMIPTSILLLGIGSLVVARTVKRERIEGHERELEKAKEMIRVETRRMLTEVQRAWTALLDQYLAEQQQDCIIAMENRIREHFARATSETAEERQRVQRQMQGLDTSERRLMPLLKNKDAISNAIAQMRGEFRQLLLTSLKVPSRGVAS